MDIEALRAKYAAAYDPEFEMPQDSGEESTDINDSDDDDDEDEEEDEEEEESEEGKSDAIEVSYDTITTWLLCFCFLRFVLYHFW